MKIIIENHIPYIAGALDPFADILYLPPEQITPQTIADADALITRTRTRCDRTLLENSRCKLIASATIGLDHVDLDYCRQAGIKVVNAPGCNAPAVAQYVLASLLHIYGTDLRGLAIGIVGVGNVGSILRRWAQALDMKVLPCDPPLAEADPTGYLPLSRLAAEADIITFHTPMTRSGRYPTYHLADSRFFNSLKRKPTIVNAARGPVVDTPALVSAIEKGIVKTAVLDCWENEPRIDRHLLSLAEIATPHIAGYSIEGKLRATHMVLNEVCRFFGLPIPQLTRPIPAPAPDIVSSDDIISSYSPLLDTQILKNNPEKFEPLRNNYNLRHEPLRPTSATK